MEIGYLFVIYIIYVVVLWNTIKILNDLLIFLRCEHNTYILCFLSDQCGKMCDTKNLDKSIFAQITNKRNIFICG